MLLENIQLFIRENSNNSKVFNLLKKKLYKNIDLFNSLDCENKPQFKIITNYAEGLKDTNHVFKKIYQTFKCLNCNNKASYEINNQYLCWKHSYFIIS